MRKLVYYIASSVDGFIADPAGDGNIYPISEEFTRYATTQYPETLPTYIRRLLGIEHAENVRFDTLLMGRGTYQLALDMGVTSPYAHMRQYVVSRSLKASPDPAVELVPEDPAAAARDLKAQDGLDIYLCGGGVLAGQLREEIDELHVKTYPVLLGSGIPMFSADFAVSDLAVTSSRVFDNGMIFTTYAMKRQYGTAPSRAPDTVRT
ncbi:dihydrofolate reductase family protein [Streptomyces sp. AM8-1-1]|uniref:dihydrofolate reductase family protein n=1 Tax=Streptomyces sp. AM8-1-1 TaxID=3075825 RepID=UPI0028C45FAC|nr:dihydrofolate reductase family protein [Streptomyces sp. AM8-1-1]WNO74532.1 dihydrofolate reductase family protein [Streptomyces sp. AM8-1-1]